MLPCAFVKLLNKLSEINSKTTQRRTDWRCRRRLSPWYTEPNCSDQLFRHCVLTFASIQNLIPRLEWEFARHIMKNSIGFRQSSLRWLHLPVFQLHGSAAAKYVNHDRDDAVSLIDRCHLALKVRKVTFVDLNAIPDTATDL